MACIPAINTILVLDNEGQRIAVNYFSNSKLTDIKDQESFEKRIFAKTSKGSIKSDAEIILFENCVAVYKAVSDAYFYVISDAGENELLVLSVLQALEESMSDLLRDQVNKCSLVENLDLLLLTIDEIVDDGNIVETDSSQVTNRVAQKGLEKMEGGAQGGDQTFAQAMNSAKDQFYKSFVR